MSGVEAVPEDIRRGRGATLLLAAFFAVLVLLGVMVVIAYVGDLRLVSLIDRERVFYEKNVDEQSTALNRVAFAVSDLLVPSAQRRDEAGFPRLMELGQAVLNHAHIPEIIDASFLKVILGDDPLFLAERASKSNETYRTRLETMAALLDLARQQGETVEGRKTLGDLVRESGLFMEELRERSRVLIQIEGAYHATTKKNLTRLHDQINLNLAAISLITALLITVAVVFILSRLAIERELKGHRENLAALVAARTEELGAANARLRTTLGEKDVLIKEVYHRVKNNLAIVASLISLQSTETGPENIEDAFEKLSQRIHAISLIHERLSHSRDFSIIDFKDYIKSLGDTLIFSLAGDKTAIDFEISAPEVNFRADILVPLGLIVTELMTNSLKYAFEGRARGRVRISLAEEEGAFVLELRDDGNPPADEKTILESASLGSRLVASLTSQIGGALELDLTGGTGVTIRFPYKPKA
jgi:two-component sensor histidine kinase